MQIRTATHLDRDDVHRIYWSAFPEGERESVAKLAVELLFAELLFAEGRSDGDASLSMSDACQVISLIAEVGRVAVGHVAFSRLMLDGNQDLQAWILAPLAVSPDHYRRGIGSSLIRTGIDQLTELQTDALLVYGDPAFYGRFGFQAEPAAGYVPPYPLEYPFGWQGLALSDRRLDQSPAPFTCVAPLCDPTLW